ncbi:MAG: DVU0298 family protein [Thermodesulfobacteriota bacterium]
MTGNAKGKRQGGRALKGLVLRALETGDETEALDLLAHIPARALVSPLFGALHRMEPRVHWTAVRVMGAVAAGLARENMEEARVVLRRMMWNLNDESGGIGWGVPEAMGEVLARHEGLAEEFTNILASYTREEANYLEHEPLQKGLLWGVARLARARPELLRAAGPGLSRFLKADDPVLRGLAAHAAGLLGLEEARSALELLLRDNAEITEDLGGVLSLSCIRDIAAKALEHIDQGGR